MYQSPYSSYYIPDMYKYECRECEKEFILSSGYDNSQAVCPYCQSQHIEAIVLMDDADGLDDLGCMAIGFLREEECKSKVKCK